MKTTIHIWDEVDTDTHCEIQSGKLPERIGVYFKKDIVNGQVSISVDNIDIVYFDQNNLGIKTMNIPRIGDPSGDKK